MIFFNKSRPGGGILQKNEEKVGKSGRVGRICGGRLLLELTEQGQVLMKDGLGSLIQLVKVKGDDLHFWWKLTVHFFYLISAAGIQAVDYRL